MSKSVRIFKSFGALMFVAAIAYLIISYRATQSQQREIQARILNKAFAKVRVQNGNVLFVPSRRGMPMQLLDSEPPSYFVKPALLSIGSKFRIGDQHFLLQYMVSRIEQNGVTIDYETDGGEPSLIRCSRGSITLGWK